MFHTDDSQQRSSANSRTPGNRIHVARAAHQLLPGHARHVGPRRLEVQARDQPQLGLLPASGLRPIERSCILSN